MMFELVPLWMAFIFGVVAAIIIECCLFCWNHSVIEHYMGLAADRMVEIADVRQENIELRHKVDEYKDQRQRSLTHIDEMHQTIARYRSELQKAKANEYIETIARYRNELRDANAKIDEYRLQMIADLRKIEEQGKQVRDLRAQVEMHRTNTAKAQDELHRFKIVVKSFMGDWKDCLGWVREDLANIYEFVKGFQDEHGLNDPALAPVDSGLTGAGPVDGDAESRPSHDAEPPQVSS